MTRDHPPGEDPIIAALPPETDYITYLTILEYNLTPEKLPTINHLLDTDDGSLAENIGWDLLSIVLPMLKDAPDDATKCLEIVSTRANPREVVIQVAGELEKLGIDEDEQDEDGLVDDDEDEDDLRTFEGEAERIHLGRLDFNGGPPSRPEASDHPSYTAKDPAQDAGKPSLRESKFLALLQMLGILHPRIKTLHPSRFLATSLTAALRVFRNIPTTSTSTKAFVNLLRTLQRAQKVTSAPPLPPRRDTGSGPLGQDADQRENMQTSQDPAIARRLLQAVALEVLEHYVLSFRAQHTSDMAWTIRLRERLEKKRALLGRRLEIERWSSIQELEVRDEMLSEFVSLAKDLDLESELHLFAEHLDRRGHSLGPTSPSIELESDTDYPASPDQIPLSVPAMVYSHAFAEFRRSLHSEKTGLLMTLSDVARVSLYLLNLESKTQHEHSNDNPPRSLPTPTVDAILALLYLQTIKPSRRRDILTLTPPTQRRLFDLLVEFFTSSPESSVRDSAHHIASILLHDNPNSDARHLTIRKVLQMTVYQDHSDGVLIEATSSVPAMMSANLRSVGVDWLKEEIVYNIQGTTPLGPATPDMEIKGLDPLLVLNDASDGLRPLLFPIIPAPPGVPLTTPTTTEKPPATLDEDKHEAHIHDFLSNLSFYISTLNLLYIFLSLVYTKRPDLHTPIEDVVKERLGAFAPWRRALLDFMDRAQPDKGSDKYHDDHEGTGDNQQVLESMGEVWAFDDAMDRLERVLEKRQKERPDGTELGHFKD